MSLIVTWLSAVKGPSSGCGGFLRSLVANVVVWLVCIFLGLWVGQGQSLKGGSLDTAWGLGSDLKP